MTDVSRSQSGPRDIQCCSSSREAVTCVAAIGYPETGLLYSTHQTLIEANCKAHGQKHMTHVGEHRQVMGRLTAEQDACVLPSVESCLDVPGQLSLNKERSAMQRVEP